MTLIDMALETEEYITAEEYMRRRNAGKVDSTKIRYALDNPVKGQIGGFYVKLDRPRYRVAIPSAKGTRRAR